MCDFAGEVFEPRPDFPGGASGAFKKCTITKAMITIITAAAAMSFPLMA
jgi:hypothetical protein